MLKLCLSPVFCCAHALSRNLYRGGSVWLLPKSSVTYKTHMCAGAGMCVGGCWHFVQGTVSPVVRWSRCMQILSAGNRDFWSQSFAHAMMPSTFGRALPPLGILSPPLSVATASADPLWTFWTLRKHNNEAQGSWYSLARRTTRCKLRRRRATMASWSCAKETSPKSKRLRFPRMRKSSQSLKMFQVYSTATAKTCQNLFENGGLSHHGDDAASHPILPYCNHHQILSLI